MKYAGGANAGRFSQTAASFVVFAQIGSGVVRNAFGPKGFRNGAKGVAVGDTTDSNNIAQVASPTAPEPAWNPPEQNWHGLVGAVLREPPGPRWTKRSLFNRDPHIIIIHLNISL